MTFRNLKWNVILSALLLTYMGIVFVGKLAMIVVTLLIAVDSGEIIAGQTNLPGLLSIVISLAAGVLAGREVVRRTQDQHMAHVLVLAGLASGASLLIGALLLLDVVTLFEAVAAFSGTLTGGWATDMRRRLDDQ